jgi:hypothetical protein
MPREYTLYQYTIRFGKEQHYINLLYKSRYYGYADLTGFINRFGLRLFFFARAHDAENQSLGFDGALGISRQIKRKWILLFSLGYLNRWPDLSDKHSPEIVSSSISERGNADLTAEKKLTGNTTIAFVSEQAEFSISFNAGKANDMIYYDRRFGGPIFLEVFPDNDNVKFADLNLTGSFNKLWIFFSNASATARRIDSDRYGNRPPYSPRWQVRGQMGLKYLVNRYQINLRLFSEITYTERPLSYALTELQTGAMLGWGVNASLKDFTFYYMVHNTLNLVHEQPEGYGYTGWFYSWGFSWKFID